MNKPEVEIEYCMRMDGRGYYFRVFVRSVSHPDRLMAQDVDRGADERRNMGIAAGAMAEALGEKYNENRDPDSAAQAAMGAYDRLNALNPIPNWDDEKPLDS